jgi:xanthine dehydrogenase YagS FAD-binding subunit
MHSFEFSRPTDSAGAIAGAAQAKTAQQGADVRFVAGGTTLIDLMKLNVETPARVIDVNRLPLDKIETTPDGGLKIGATVRNSDLANHPTVRRDTPAIAGHSRWRFGHAAWRQLPVICPTHAPRTRDIAMPCNKRACPTAARIAGSNRTLAIRHKRTWR